MKIFQDLQWRGLIKQVSSEKVESLLNESKVTFYCGFDPTAESLHVGSLLPLITMKRLQMAGHIPLALVGGATGMIGDPSFKKDERSMLSDEVLAKNLKGITKSINQVLDNVEIVNNHDWLKNISLLDFLRVQGKMFSVNNMIARDSVRERIQDPSRGISFTEFTYQLLQAEDFRHLFSTKNCILTIGGSDQWSNGISGVDLIRRSFSKEAFVLTTPLLLKSDGTKFGKSENGSVWLDSGKTTPFDFFQFFFRTEEKDVVDLLKKLTFLTETEITELALSLNNEPEKRKAQQALASEVTRVVHGDKVLKEVLEKTESLFGKKTFNVPDLVKPKSDVIGVKLVDVLVMAGLSSSKTMARKEIEGGGISIDEDRVFDINQVIQENHIVNSLVVLKKGRKNIKVIKVE